MTESGHIGGLGRKPVVVWCAGRETSGCGSKPGWWRTSFLHAHEQLVPWEASTMDAQPVTHADCWTVQG